MEMPAQAGLFVQFFANARSCLPRPSCSSTAHTDVPCTDACCTCLHKHICLASRPIPLSCPAAPVSAPPRLTCSQVRFYNNDTVALSLVGENGPRLSSKDMMKYGLYTARAQVDQHKGCVTAFYVSSTTNRGRQGHSIVHWLNRSRANTAAARGLRHSLPRHWHQPFQMLTHCLLYHAAALQRHHQQER
jgi:hypothetical protein